MKRNEKNVKRRKKNLNKSKTARQKKISFCKQRSVALSSCSKTNLSLKNSLELQFSKMLFGLSSVTVLKGNLQPNQDSLHKQLKLTAS